MFNKLFYCITLLVLFPCMLHAGSAILLSDTIAPSVSAMPQDLVISCEVPFQSLYDEWIVDNGGMVAEDSGGVTYFNTFIGSNLGAAIAGSSDTLCGRTAIIPIGFYALDDCQNSTDTLFVNFKLEDKTAPSIVMPAQDVTVSCDVSVQDSLENWINSFGEALAVDACGDVTWSNYTWEDNFGNSGFDNFGDSIKIAYLTSACDWSASFSLFVVDECDNANVVTGTFTVTDMVPPSVGAFLNDTLISCVDTLPNLTPDFIDDCGGELIIETITTATQSDDPNSCDFYNYSISNDYTVTDVCGNSFQLSQTIMIADTMGPIVIAAEDITIDCNDNLNENAIFLDSLIDCSTITISFEDEALNESECSNTFLRKWNFTDVCGNESLLDQMVTIIDQTGPEIEGDIPSFSVECESINDFQDAIEKYIARILSLETRDNCGTGSVTILQENSAAEASFDFQFVPNQSCGGNSILQQESIAINITDECGNLNLASSTLLILDSIPPTILSCPKELTFNLPVDSCSLNLPLVQFTTDTQCDSIETLYYFAQEQTLTNVDSTDFPSANFRWNLIPNSDPIITEPVEIILKFQSIVDENLELNFVVVDMDGNEYFSFDDSINSCEEETISFFISEDQFKPWVQAGQIRLQINFDIENLADCQEELIAGMRIIAPTLLLNPVKYIFKLNDGEEKMFSQGDSISISSGINTLSYITEDCAGNRDSCVQMIEIIDTEVPEIICPDDLSIEVAMDSCSSQFKLDPDFEFVENCKTQFNFMATLPENNNRFLSFSELADSSYLADDIQLIFENIDLSALILNPVLIIEILANTEDENAYFNILDENGGNLGTTPRSEQSCFEPQSIQIDLSIAQLKSWASDDQIEFNFVKPSIDSGLSPCDLENFEGQTDQSSFLTASLAFTEVNPSITITNKETTDTISIVDSKVTLIPGEYLVELMTSDNSNNSASCSYSISVEDLHPPSVSCETNTLEIAIEMQGNITPTLDELIFEADDNCDSIALSLDIPTIDCRNIGESLTSMITAIDESGNSTSCEFSIAVVEISLSPSFSSSLCGGESLSLLHNINLAQEEDLNFAWSGPQGFSSSEENPEIDGVTSGNSGDYILEVTNELGCVFTGSVSVVIETLDSPEISSTNDLVCEGEALVLNSNTFNDDVLYKWYEGTSPNGVLLGETTIPSIQINPSVGPHNYYAIVTGNGCESNPSEPFSISVVQSPTAMVKDNFITLCEGESFTLETANTNPTLEFEWSGPQGYTSTDPNPAIINNADILQQGTYQLVVYDRGCESAPALVEVVIFPTPDRPIIAGDNILCQGGELKLSVTNVVSADKYNWYLNGILYSITNTNSLIVLMAQQQLSGDWTVVIEDGNCISPASLEFVVEVESQITLGAGNDGPSCEGGSVTLTASFIPDASYLWITPNNQQFFDRIITVPAVAGLYTVTASTATGCEGSASTVVEIIEVPVITALSNNSTNCLEIGNTIEFFPSIFPPGNYNYFWTGPNGFSSNVENLSIDYLGAISNGTYTLQVQNNNCFTEVASTIVNSTVNPPQPIITLQGGVCLGDPLSILASNVDNQVDNYLWETPIGQITTMDPIFMVSATTSAYIGSYQLIAVTNGCPSEPSEPLNLSLLDEVEIPSIEGTESLCIGQRLELSVIASDPMINYTWSTPEGILVPGPVLSIEPFEISDAGDYYVRAENNGCNSEFSDPFMVSVISGPEAPEVLIDEFRVCENEVELISLIDFIMTEDNLAYLLYDENENLLETSVSGNFDVIDLTGYSPGIYIFSIASSLDDCESETRTAFSIIIEAIPMPAQFQNPILKLCELSIEQVLISTPNNVQYDLELFGGNFEIQSQVNNSLIINIFDFGEGRIVLTSMDDICGEFATDTLFIQAIGSVIANDDSYTIDQNSTSMLDVLDNDEYLGSVDLSIINEVGQPQGNFVGDQLVIAEITEPGMYQLTYTICSEQCPELCDEGTVNLEVENTTIVTTECEASSLMTPNGDGTNDFFVIPCINSVDEINLKVFNGVGSLVYESNDYDNQWSADYDGELLPLGTYYYVYQINNETPKSGYIIVEL